MNEKDLSVNIFIIIISLIIIFFGNKTKPRIIYRIRVVFVSLIMLCIFNFLFYDMNYLELQKNNEFIGQIINISGVFVGFIFAGVSILFSLIGLNKMKSEFANGFLDKVFHKSFLCITSSLLVLIVYSLINIKICNSLYMYKFMIYSFSFSLFYIVWCLIDYFKLIFESKKT